MTNPFLMALKTNPTQFLGEMTSKELEALTLGCVAALEKKAKRGDRDAALALQQAYRIIGAVEI